MKPVSFVPLASIVLAGCLAGPSKARPVRPPWTGPRSTPDAEFRKHAPLGAPAEVYGGPRIQELRLDNGVRILVVERHDFPVVSLAIMVKRGAADAPPGVAELISRMLLGGTEKSDEQQIANRLGDITYGTDANYDAVWISAKMLSSNFVDTFPTLAQLVSNAALPEARFTKQKERLLDEINEGPGDTTDALMQVIDANLYPPSHPFHVSVTGNAVGVWGTTHERVVQAYKEMFKPDQAAVVVVGNVAAAAVFQVARQSLRHWKGNAPERSEPADPKSGPIEPRVVIVDRPGLTQSTVLFATPGISRTNPSYETMLLLSAILGAPFTGRLNMNLRERHGYTYGAESILKARRYAGPFYVGGSVETASTADAVREMLKELARLRTERLTTEELAAARLTFQRALAQRFETIDGTVGAASQLALYDLPVDDYARLGSRLADVRAEHIHAAANRYLAPDRLRLFILGDAARFRPQIEALGIGSVSVIASKGRANPQPAD
jgi:zinc protease